MGHEGPEGPKSDTQRFLTNILQCERFWMEGSFMNDTLTSNCDDLLGSCFEFDLVLRSNSVAVWF